MLDECVVMSYTAGARNEFNEPDAPTYTDSEPIQCGLDMRPSSERHSAEMTAIQFDATLRLPIHTLLKETDRIRITARFGLYPDELIYEIASPIQRGPSGIRLILKKVTA